MTMQTALVTGATGLVGSHLAERLLREGWRVRALVRPHSRSSELEAQGVQLVVGELSDRQTLRQAAQGVEVVFHCAARPPLGGNREQFYRDNVEGTVNVLDACLQGDVERLVHVSTVDVYGYVDHDGADERTPFRADGLYSWSKIEAERAVMRYHDRYGLPIVIVRPCLIYGPRDRHLLPSLLAIVERGRAWLVRRGQALVDLVYISDVVEALLLAAQAREAVSQAYNVTDGARRTVREVIDVFAQALDQTLKYIHVPYPLAYGLARVASALGDFFHRPIPPELRWEVIKAMGHHRHFDISKAQRELGYQPEVPLEEGLRRTLAWHEARVRELQAIRQE